MIHRKQQQDPSADIKKHVIVSFIKRKHLKLRRVQRNKKTAKEEFRAAIAKWHSTLRERLVKTGRSRSNYHPVYGGFMPEQRLNVDQSPLPFVIDTKSSQKVGSASQGQDWRNDSAHCKFVFVLKENNQRLVSFFEAWVREFLKLKSCHGIQMWMSFSS